MKVLMLSTDSQMFNEASAVRARILEYGKLFEELHVIIYTKEEARSTKHEARISNNIFLYPTNSRFKFLYFRDAYRIAKRIIHNSSFVIHNSVITSQDPFETGLVAYWLKKKFGIPWQVQIHTDFLSPYFRRQSLKNFFRVILAKRLIRKADRVRVVSDRIKRSLSALFPKTNSLKPIDVLPIFIDLEKVRSASPDSKIQQAHKKAGEFLILTVARNAPEKNLALAERIVTELKQRHSQLRWLLISNAGSALPYYKGADLFLLTSNYEGYGLVTVEAAAAGVPVVMTDVGVAIGETFPVGDATKAVEIIDKLIKYPKEREAVVARQNEFLKTLSGKEEYLRKYKDSLTF